MAYPTHRILLASLSSLAISAPAVLGAAVTTWTGPDGGDWGNPSNWDNGVPGISDEISLGGGNPVVTDVQGYKDFDTNAPVTTGTITINNGGYLSTDGGHHGAWGITGITINSGGTFFNDPVTESNIARLRTNVDVNAGGTLVGFSAIQGVLNISGLYQPYNSASANVVSVESNTTLNAGGVIEMDIFGTGDNESFGVTGGDTLELSIVGSTVLLVPQGGYTPGVSDTFDLWNGAGTTNVIGDASNVEVFGHNVVWDTTQWTSDGVLTVAAVPEPSTFAFAALLGALGVMVRRKRKQA